MTSSDSPIINLQEVERENYEYYSSSDLTKIPEISVVVSTFNRFRPEGDCECLLKRAIDSILYQTFSNFELILIDDFSRDHTKEYCKEIALTDSRVHFFHFKKNSGTPAKRYNFGISKCRGKYITFMFDDDHWEKNALEDLYYGIVKSNRHCGMVYGLSTHYHGNDRINFEVLGEKWSWNKIHSRNFISNNSVIVKKSVIDLVGGYDEDLVFQRLCDWDLWWRIGRKFMVKRIKSKIGNVYCELPDSIFNTRILNLEACKKRQSEPRDLPLQVNMKEPLRCKIQSLCFDSYVNSYLKLKNSLPTFVFLFLKKIKNAFKRTSPQGK